jgi:hypothetical protein
MTDRVAEAQPTRRWIGGVGAILTGFFVVVILSLGTDIALHEAGVFPRLGQPMSDPLFFLATVYRILYAVVGSYVTARLAPSRPMLHALIGGLIGLLLSTVGAVVTWNREPEFGPHWYPLALVVTAMPSAWLGGKLRILQLGKHARP